MKQIITLLLFLLIIQTGFTQINTKDVTIIRDQVGVPHIYGKTDADMVYGLAWAACEDDFTSIQENFLATRGRLAEVKGKEGAIMDVLAHIVQAQKKSKEVVTDSLYSPHFEKMVGAYVQAVNDYAKKYPEELFIKNTFPVTKQDVIAANILALAIISNVQYEIIRSFDNTMDIYEIPQSAGSNAFAANKNKTKNGETYLCLNSHQPLTGPYAWYEAHINSEESGINMYGATFPGGMTMFIGANEHLGWSHTINYPDHVDTYKLKMHPKNKLQYELDGKWETLEKYPIKLKVKLGFIKIPITKKFYISKHGIVIKNKEGFYAIRFRANMEFRAAEQWYEMNKATNLEEFKKALEMQYIPGTNTIYADKESNLFFISLGQFPERNKSYNWTKVLPGNQSQLIWGDEMYPIEKLPQLTNPNVGYIYNTNNSPFNCTSPENSLDSKNYDVTFGYQTKDNNRAIRCRYLFEQKDKIDYQDFKDIKYDNYYHTPLYTASIQGIEKIFHLDATKYPDIAESIKLLSEWDRKTDVDRKAGIASIALFLITEDVFKKGLLPGVNTISETDIVKFVRKGQKHLKKHFGKTDVTIGEIQRLYRGDKDYPIGGMADVLAAMNFERGKKGKLKAFLGDSFIQFVKWTENGIEMEATNSLGASNKKESEHYDDQIKMYLEQKLRPVYLDKNKVIATQKRTYHPGE